jgi:mannose-1-phosphate guanylyltransferase
MPADHLITPRSAFIRALSFSHRFCIHGHCVTYGIPPRRPDTGYGYIKVGTPLTASGSLQAFRGLAFTEKPTRARARQYVRSKKYLWNSGIFSFSAGTILAEIRKHTPRIYQGVTRYVATRNKKHFEKVPNISIDYAVMEKSDRLCIIQGNFLWDDVGSWLALERYFVKDSRQNIVRGDVKSLEIKDSIIYTSTMPCRVYGIKGLIIVTSPHGVLVCAKDKAPDLKRLLNT